MEEFVTRLFADASASYPDAYFTIFGVPYDGTTSFRPGTRYGPDAIRALSINFESYVPRYDIDLADVPFIDLGDIQPAAVPDRVIEQVEATVLGLRIEGKVPIMLGGEHSATIGSVRAVKPDCFIVCDAHLDLRADFAGTSCSHACTTRRIYEDGTREIVIIGARSGTREQFAFAEEVTLYTAEDVLERGIRNVVDEVAGLVGGRSVYLSIDADAIDCTITPGLGTPEPFGLSPRDIREVIARLAPSTVAFDYMEVCPIDAGQTAAVAAQMVREFIACRWRSETTRRESSLHR
jgi:agmatinase